MFRINYFSGSSIILFRYSLRYDNVIYKKRTKKKEWKAKNTCLEIKTKAKSDQNVNFQNQEGKINFVLK